VTAHLHKRQLSGYLSGGSESAEGAPELVEMRWGLVPYWSKEPKIPYSTFNARAETMASRQPGGHSARGGT
jgi:putative SOS response-associated peptidase YedK